MFIRLSLLFLVFSVSSSLAAEPWLKDFNACLSGFKWENDDASLSYDLQAFHIKRRLEEGKYDSDPKLKGQMQSMLSLIENSTVVWSGEKEDNAAIHFVQADGVVTIPVGKRSLRDRRSTYKRKQGAPPEWYHDLAAQDPTGELPGFQASIYVYQTDGKNRLVETRFFDSDPDNVARATNKWGYPTVNLSREVNEDVKRRLENAIVTRINNTTRSYEIERWASAMAGATVGQKSNFDEQEKMREFRGALEGCQAALGDKNTEIANALVSQLAKFDAATGATQARNNDEGAIRNQKSNRHRLLGGRS